MCTPQLFADAGLSMICLMVAAESLRMTVCLEGSRHAFAAFP